MNNMIHSPEDNKWVREIPWRKPEPSGEESKNCSLDKACNENQ